MLFELFIGLVKIADDPAKHTRLTNPALHRRFECPLSNNNDIPFFRPYTERRSVCDHL